MALDLNLGAAFAGASNLPVLPWLATSLKVMENDGSLMKLSDVFSPLDRQAVVKITNTRIANVYNTLAKGSIPIGNQAVNTTGQSIFCELSATASEDVGGTLILSPMVARIELRLPNNGSLTDALAATLLQATYTAMCTPATKDLRALAMMRGVLYPTN